MSLLTPFSTFRDIFIGSNLQMNRDLLQSPDEEFDSLTLYNMCNSSDIEQQERAYRVLWQYLYRVAFQMVYDHPERESLAQDTAQKALIRIHEKLDECKEPKAFRTWSKRITTNLMIDDLRRRKRLLPIADETDGTLVPAALKSKESPAEEVITSVHQDALRGLLNQAPISERSRRVVVGRYFDDVPDETLAQVESGITEKAVRPSHIQVTRAKNIGKLRQWDQLSAFFE